MIGFIISTGNGTRLKQLFPDTPKVLVPVHGQPFLKYLLTLMASHGIKDVYIAANPRNYKSIACYVSQYGGGYADMHINVIRFKRTVPFEEAFLRLGTIVPNPRAEAIFLTCCDNIAPVNLYELQKMLEERGLDEVMVTPRLGNTAGYSVVALSEDKIVTNMFRQDTEDDEAYIDGGMCLLRHDVVERVLSFENCFQDYIPYALALGKIGAYIPEAWFDIGNPNSYMLVTTSSQFRRFFGR